METNVAQPSEIGLRDYLAGQAPPCPDSFELPQEYLEHGPPGAWIERSSWCSGIRFPEEPIQLRWLGCEARDLQAEAEKRNERLRVLLWPYYWADRQLKISGRNTAGPEFSISPLDTALLEPMQDKTEFNKKLNDLEPLREQYYKEVREFLYSLSAPEPVKRSAAIQQKPWWKFW